MSKVVLSITGAHSGCGKTSVAETLIRGIPIKWAAIKYTGTELYSSLTDDPEIINRPGKDTWRLARAGAEKVIWIQSPPEDLDELLSVALTNAEDYRGIMVEGNSPAFIIKPDLIVFVYGDDPSRVKLSAVPLIERADFIITPERALCGIEKKMYYKYSETDTNRLINDIMRRFSIK